jgi:hypothetical protein
MPAGPLGSLQRGILNLRANRELILLLWLGRGLVVLLTLASLVPFYLVLNVDLPDDWSTGEEYLVWVSRTIERLAEQIWTAPFWMAVVASSAVLTVVLFVAAFFQAGAFGVLASGELAGTPGSTVVAGFRSYSWSGFQAAAGARLWRYFWLLNLILCLWLVWALLGALAAVATGVAFAGAGLGGGLALGCLSVLPLSLAVVLLTFWGWLAQAQLGLSDCGVWAALGSGLRIVLRRFGSMLVLFVFLTALMVGAGVVFLLLTVSLEAGLAAFETVRVVSWWGLQTLQWVVGTVIHLTFAAALVAVVRQEWSGPAVAEEE